MEYKIWDSQAEKMLTSREREYFFPGADGTLKRIKQIAGSVPAGKTLLFSAAIDKGQALYTYIEDAEPKYHVVESYEDAAAYSRGEVFVIESLVKSILSGVILSHKAIDRITEYVVEALDGEDISRESVSRQMAKYLER